MTGILQQRKFAIHIAFWFVYASFFFFQISSGRRIEEIGWPIILQDFAFHMLAMMVLGYLNYFFFMTRLLRHRKILRYMLELIPVFIALSYLVVLGKQFILDGFQHKIAWVYSARFTSNVILSAFSLVIFVGLLRFVEDYFELEAKKQELENENLSSELRFLKSQINPHFLFNTLNNLYYLAFTKSPNTAEVIAKLAQMMRYMLYDSVHTRVAIEKELEYMQNYISLEQLRLNNEVPIKYVVEGQTEGVRIAPMVFVTFLENAFKHGISNSNKNSWVDIYIHVSNGVCTYSVSNSKIKDSEKTVTEESGIGLLNVKRRLDLSYENHYKLDVKETKDSYSVELKLDLT